MAIKGKGRTRGRRVVAAPPRPAIVVRKKPFYKRRSVWIAAGAVALAAILFGVFLGIRSRTERAEREREVAAMDTFTNMVRNGFPPGARPVPPSGYELFPELREDLGKLAGGELSAEEASQKGERLEQQARASAEKIDPIVVREVIPEEFPQTRLDLIDSQFMMVQALNLYERVGGLMRSAADAAAPAKKALGRQATQLASSAETLFNRGYQALVNERIRLGIHQSLPPQPPT